MARAEDEPTLRDESSKSAAASVTESGWTRAPSLSATLLGPMQALHQEEVRRIRVFAWLTVPFGLIVAGVLPLTEHDPYTLGAMVSGLLVYAAVTIQLLLALRGARELPVRPVMLYGIGCLYAATTGVYHFGLFSPAVMGIALGLFFFSPSTSFPAALALYLSGAAMHGALAAATLGGAIADRGVMRATGLGQSEQVLIQLLVHVVLLASFVIGRATRKATLSAIQAHDEAMQQLERRDELLAEARQDLAEALEGGKLGHYSDQQLGDFVLGEVIGRGAMGEVYQAMNVKTAERAAIKLLHRHALRDPEYVRRFIREAKIAAAIDSPHVCRVLEVGGLDAPLPYLAMELLTGKDLAEMLRARPRLSMRDVVRLVREAGAGLDAARAAGIVHRDVNPHNLFAAETAETTVWKLLDFGVARQFDPGAGATRAEIAGTPQYMAPELALGKEVDHRADLFSLGAVAYRALTGHAPFAGSGVPDTLMHVVHRMPPRPSDLCRVPVELDLVLGIALAKDAEHRFDSGAELARAFERAARGEMDAELRARAEQLLAGLPWRAKVA